MTRAFQWDLARQVERLDALLKLLPRYAAWGYEELYLHLEDAVEYPSLPGVARRDAYTYRQLGRLAEAAARAGIRVVPIINLLGHTQYLLKAPALRDLNELRAADGSPLERGQICPLHPRMLEVAEKLLRDMAPFCTAGKAHVGLDESFHLGQCPRCRAEVARRGLAAHFAGHAQRLHALCGKLGLRLGMWADMLYFVPEAIPLLPRDVTAYDWYYYPFGRLPRVECFNFAERDIATPLKQRGIAYYGCPMNGAFRFEPLPVFGERLANIRSWWRRCREIGAEGFLVTSWEAQRLALEMTTVVDAAAASLWLEPEIDDATAMLARGFERAFPRLVTSAATPRRWARAALACDDYAFAGYARWQINERWDVLAGNEGVAPYAAEERFFHRLQAGANDWPLPFTASAEFRHYLAARDVFVRRAARAVFRLRRLLRKAESGPLGTTAPTRATARDDRQGFFSQIRAMKSAAIDFTVALRTGRRAARAMWRRTRDPRVRGQNEAMLDADAARWRGWRAWLRRAASHPEIVWQDTPVCGAWQLQFVVRNFAPAAQKVVVEQQGADGAWEELAGRFTIEFRAWAARPRTKIQRAFTAPVHDSSRPLRIAVRGVGQVAISHVALTNGVTTLRPLRWPLAKKKILGRAAPRRGFPEVDWRGNRGVVALPWGEAIYA